MKQKDLVYLVLAVVIFLAAGYIGYTQLIPAGSQAKKTVEVEKVGVIPESLDSVGLAALNNEEKSVNYNSAPDFKDLGNTAPFGQ